VSTLSAAACTVHFARPVGDTGMSRFNGVHTR
jgi:hypothetical protein